MEELKVKAPAKINLGLNVISKRDDSYHNIETIFYPVSLYDILIFKESDNFIFTTNNDELNSSPDNLIVKAKKLLEEETKSEININIHLEKNIPVGAGLGGGSSDAAVVLTVLNNIFGLKVDKVKLESLAFRLGSDVPFFLNPRPCYASSRGEILEERDLKIKYPILIVNPGIHVSTKWAYSNIIPRTPEFNLRDLTQDHLDAPDKLHTILKNDFEDLVLDNFPEVKMLKDELFETEAMLTLMSGSGSSFFSVYRNNSSAEDAKKMLEKKYFILLHQSEK